MESTKNSIIKAFRFEVVMDYPFLNWNPRAKERLLVSDKHASDFTRGNIDYNVEFSTWQNRTLYGDVILLVPKKYLERGETWHAEADDAVRNTIKYVWPDIARELVTNIKVIKQIKPRSRRTR